MIVIEDCSLYEASITNILKGEVIGSYTVLRDSVEKAIGYVIRENIHYYTAKQVYGERTWIELTEKEKQNIVNVINKKLDKIGGKFISNLSFTPKSVDDVFQNMFSYNKNKNKFILNVSRIIETNFADNILSSLLNDNVAENLKNCKYRFNGKMYTWFDFNENQKEFVCDYANTYMNKLFSMLSGVTFNKIKVFDIDNAEETLQLKLA